MAEVFKLRQTIVISTALNSFIPNHVSKYSNLMHCSLTVAYFDTSLGLQAISWDNQEIHNHITFGVIF